MVRAPPRVLPRSLALSGVLGGGRPGPGSPLLGLGLLGRRQGVPGGVPSSVAWGVRGLALLLPRLPVHWVGCRGPRCGRGRAGVGALLCPCGGCAPRGGSMAFLCWGAGWGGGGGACAVSSGCASGAGPVGRGVALPLSVPLPSLGRQQSGRHWRCAVHGGCGPPYHSGSCSPGFSGYDLCGVPVRRRGPACSSRPPCEPAAGSHSGSPLGPGGPIPPASGGGGRGPRGWRAGGGAGVGGGCRAAASLLSFRAAACGTPFSPSPCHRRAPFRRARAVGAEVPPQGGGGSRGGRWTAPPGAPAELNPPSVTSEWAVVTGGSCGARPPSCSIVRVAPARRCGLAGAGPAAVALTASPFLLRGGAPPRPWGGGGPRLWLPS